MLVQCPNCKTTYKVADEVLKGAAPAFRCSRCRHTFELEAETTSDAVTEHTEETKIEAGPPVQDQELSFSFPPKETPAAVSPSSESQKESSAAPPPGLSSANADDQQTWSMDSSVSHKDEPPFTLPDEVQAAELPKVTIPADIPVKDVTVSPRADSGDEAVNILPMSSYLDQQASIGPYLTLFVILVIGFALIAVISHAHPNASEEVIKKIPLFGASVLRNSHLKDGVLIQSLRGGYQSVQGNREVFVVTGTVVNQNPVVVREIQVTGKVYDRAGRELEHQTIWIGNTISTKIMRGMTLEDIPHLQSLKPLKSFEMPPGDSVGFAIVFLKAAKSAKDFSCEVALAGGEV
jgi:predicted Zn finger-like uncharacterized protein